MPETLFGNKTAAKILLYLHEREKGHANGIARDLKLPLNMVQKQLERFKKGNILSARFIGRNKVYFWNSSLPIHRPLRRVLETMAGEEKKSSLDFRDPADGTDLSLKDRLGFSERLLNEAEELNPYPRYRPFTKSFESFKEYEAWKKRQTNPWLL
ncbi:MAG: winged helix-turn-helix domain-containing protein [bacterium]|nr:winged helix-turn-helix domain-containing protein [bacterium]